MDLPAFLGWAGVVNAGLLALAAGLQGRQDNRAAWLAIYLAVVSAAIAAILFSQATHGPARSLWLTAEFALTLAAGPTLFHYIRAAVGRPMKARQAAAHYSPAIVFVLASLAVASTGRVLDLSVGWAIAVQLAYTIASAWTGIPPGGGR